jgi:hypothetical protein
MSFIRIKLMKSCLLCLILLLGEANAENPIPYFPTDYSRMEITSPKERNRSLFYTVGKNEEYKTIQSAIDSANLHGGGTVYLEPGKYYENLTLYPGITLEGCGIADLRFVCIYGTQMGILTCYIEAVFLKLKMDMY